MSRINSRYPTDPLGVGRAATCKEMAGHRVMVYRAMPSGCEAPRVIRPGYYVTLSRRFAREHALTSAIYHGENFDVVRVWADYSSITEASNPGEFLWDSEPVAGRVSLVADDSGNISRA